MQKAMIDKELFIRKLMQLCQQPMTIIGMATKLQMSYSTVYKYIIMLEENHKVIKTLDKSTGTKKYWYHSADGMSPSAAKIERYVKKLPKAKDSDKKVSSNKITDKGVIVRNGTSTVVHGFNGYHPKRDRAKSSEKTYVSGSTLEGF